MARICMRCKKQLQPQEEIRTDQLVTQGMCSLCTFQLTQDVSRVVRELLDIIPEPVLVFDSNGIVKAANKNGLKLLGKKSDEIEGYPGGNVFDCAFANLPEGCGRTDHCKTCAIRNIVMDTLMHGKGYKNVPAFQNIRTPKGNRIMRFYISTEKVDELILLRIDDVTEKGTA